jgi:enolase
LTAALLADTFQDCTPPLDLACLTRTEPSAVILMETHIEKITGRKVWDSRGYPTVEAEMRLACGALGRAIAPAGKSTGANEALDLRDGGLRGIGAFGVRRAVANVNGEIATCLQGIDACDQQAVDEALIKLDGTPGKSRLGANATVAVSMAAAHAAAAAQRVPLFRYLAGSGSVTLPLPEIQILGGGAHAGRRVDVQDFMIVALAARSFAEALEMTGAVYFEAGRLLAASGKLVGVADEGGYWPDFSTNDEALEFLVRAIEQAGYVPGTDVGISLDIAASQFFHSGRYRLGLNRLELDSDALSELLLGWLTRFPIVSIEDPLAENDSKGLQKFTAAVQGRVQIVADDFVVTNADRIKAAAEAGICNAALLKPNQVGTLTETRTALDAARTAGWATIVSARSGETEDTTIVHLAAGWNAGQLKVGSFARSERMAKWNEGLRIEEMLGSNAIFAGAHVLSRG